MNFVIVSFGAGAGGVGGVGGGGGCGGGWGIGSTGGVTGGVGACGDEPLHAQTDDASTDTTTARAITREAACRHFGAASGFRAATHSRNAIRMPESLMLDFEAARPWFSQCGAAVNSAHSGNNEPAGRSESPTILSEKSTAARQQQAILPLRRARMSSWWLTDLSA
jgi:hypothetical protein